MFSAQGEFKFNTLLLPQGNYQRPLGGVLISMAWTNSCQGKVGIAQNAHQTGGFSGVALGESGAVGARVP